MALFLRPVKIIKAVGGKSFHKFNLLAAANASCGR